MMELPTLYRNEFTGGFRLFLAWRLLRFSGEKAVSPKRKTPKVSACPPGWKNLWGLVDFFGVLLLGQGHPVISREKLINGFSIETI